jgi:hypothetical protein
MSGWRNDTHPRDGFESMQKQSIIPSGEATALDRPRVAKPALHGIASTILFTVVVLAPLPFGSVDALPIVAWCMALGIALASASLRALDTRHFRIIAGVLFVVGAYVLVLHEQLAARPFFAVSVSVPDPVWQAAADVLGSPVPPSVSMVRDQPLFALGAPLAAMLCLLVSFIVCVDRRRAYQLLSVVA